MKKINLIIFLVFFFLFLYGCSNSFSTSNLDNSKIIEKNGISVTLVKFLRDNSMKNSPVLSGTYYYFRFDLKNINNKTLYYQNNRVSYDEDPRLYWNFLIVKDDLGRKYYDAQLPDMYNQDFEPTAVGKDLNHSDESTSSFTIKDIDPKSNKLLLTFQPRLYTFDKEKPTYDNFTFEIDYSEIKDD